MADSIEEADLVIIGAGPSHLPSTINHVLLTNPSTGWFGLGAAKTYIQVHPEARVVLLEAESSVGGVWSNDRLYPLLKSNNMVGTYENPDYPMDEATWGVKPGEHIPAQVLHDYLTAFAKKFGVLERTRFNSRVERVERGKNGGWKLTVGGEKGSVVVARKLIVATGMTSQPFLPKFEGQEEFGKPLFHSGEFLKNRWTLETVKKVTILGGTKSAWDAVYAYATKGIEVDWVIRGN